LIYTEINTEIKVERAMKTAAMYIRVSTDQQTTDNQRLELEKVAQQSGWAIAYVFEDAGISGSKGRDKRPGLDAMLKAATKRQFDVVMAWSVDRLGRSLQDLIATMNELQAVGVDLYLHQQAIDTSTPSGKALFQMCGVFAEFERSMIVERVNAGLTRARAQGRIGGRPKVSEEIEAKIHELREEGHGILKIAKTLGVGTSVVQRVVSTRYPIKEESMTELHPEMSGTYRPTSPYTSSQNPSKAIPDASRPIASSSHSKPESIVHAADVIDCE
jgi:DNA invertase Pin-like site-specific DNA recombinase